MAHLRQGPGYRSAHAVPDHRMSDRVGTQRHGGGDLPRDPSAQGHRQVAHARA